MTDLIALTPIEDRTDRAWPTTSDSRYLFDLARGEARGLRSLSLVFPADYGESKRVLIEQVVRRINVLLALAEDWDSRHARAIAPSAALMAVEWLELVTDEYSIPPQVFPLWSGGLQLEWLADGDALEIEVSSDARVGVLGVDSAGNVIVEGEHPDPDGVDFIKLARKHLGSISMTVRSSIRA